MGAGMTLTKIELSGNRWDGHVMKADITALTLWITHLSPEISSADKPVVHIPVSEQLAYGVTDEYCPEHGCLVFRYVKPLVGA
jgi:hypothetical protein